MKYLLLFFLLFTSCTTVKNRNAEFTSPGSVAVLDMKANGDIHAEKIDSPITELVSAITKGMWGAILSLFR